MSGDDLSIQLFIAGLGVTLLALGVSQAGWRHKVLLWLLFSMAAALIGMAVFWGSIKAYYPSITLLASAVASSPWSWFCLLIFSFSAVSLLDLGTRVGWIKSSRDKEAVGNIISLAEMQKQLSATDKQGDDNLNSSGREDGDARIDRAKKVLALLVSRSEVMDEIIDLPALATLGMNCFTEKRFIRCTIFGPMAIAVSGQIRLTKSGMGRPMEAGSNFNVRSFVVDLGSDGRWLTGVAAFVDCEIIDSHMENLIFLVQTPLADALARSFPSE